MIQLDFGESIVMPKNPIKKIGHLFRAGISNFQSGFLAYHPDAYTTFNEHQEFRGLFEKFRNHNKRINGGDITRLWSLMLNIKQVTKENVAGDFAEVGVWRGNTAAVLAYYAKQLGRDVFLFDTFEGFSKKDLKGVDAGQGAAFSNTSLDMVKKVVGLDSDRAHLVQGWFPDSVTEQHRNRKYAVVSLDCDLYAPMKAGLDFFYPRMSGGGVLFLHDYSSQYWIGATKAIDEWAALSGERIILMPDKSGSAFVRKTR